MSNVLILGDGPLAYEIAALAERSGHNVAAYLVNHGGPEADPIAGLGDFLDAVSGPFDLAVEAFVADITHKMSAIWQIEEMLNARGPLLAATLNASATEVGGWTNIPDRIVGWAALPPLEDARVFEMSSGLRSAPESVQRASDFLLSLGKEPVMTEDSVGGVLPRIVANLVNEAAFALTEGIAEPGDIDQAMKLGMNYPHGPLAWGDLIGLDQVAGIISALGEVYGNDRYRLAPALRQLALAGWWGQRTGQGFYAYPG